MIIKGNPCGNVGFWSKHLMRDDTNARAEVVEISGLLATDLPTALREMKAIGAQSRSHGNSMYQANINPREGEQLTPEQWKEAVDTLEKNLGLEGHQRIVIEHDKEGRVHRHVVWNRVDVETLRVADMGGNYRIHMATARELERRFDHTPTPTPAPAIARTPATELWELRAAERSGIDPAAMKAELTELWHGTDSGKAFVAALDERGYILAKGDRRDFCVIDQAGDAHSLARRVDGVKAAAVRERMADIDRDSLPSVKEARQAQRDIQRAAEKAAWIEQKQIERDPTSMERNIQTLQDSAATPNALAAALYRDGITIARVDKPGLESLARDQNAAFQEDKMLPVPKLADGELVAVNRAGGVHKLNPYKVDMAALEAALTTGEKTVPALGYARDEIAADRAAAEKQSVLRSQEKQERREATSAQQQADWKKEVNANRARIADPAKTNDPLTVAVSGAAEKLIDFVTGLLAGDTQPKPKQTHSQAAAFEQIKANRRALAAIENIAESMERGENLRPSDIQALTPTHLENIRTRGDAYVRELIEAAERRRDRYLDFGRARER